jgi:hypothetical protein
MTQKNQKPFPAKYHITTPCYLTTDGRWTPSKDEAGAFHSNELPYRFWDGCTFERTDEEDDTK